jgi:hypothetical protein
MAASALIGNFREELILANHSYFMGGMAVLTGGQFLYGPAHGGAMDAFHKFGVNPPMAGATSGRNIFDINRRPIIFMGQNEVTIMAIGTYRAGEQAFLLQSYPVDTGRVIYDHIPFFDSRHPGRLPPFAVTFAAKARDVGPIRRGILVPRG